VFTDDDVSETSVDDVVDTVRQIIPVRVPDPGSNLTDSIPLVIAAVAVAASDGSGSIYGGG
jgi:hypothetical protein